MYKDFDSLCHGGGEWVVRMWGPGGLTLGHGRACWGLSPSVALGCLAGLGSSRWDDSRCLAVGLRVVNWNLWTCEQKLPFVLTSWSVSGICHRSGKLTETVCFFFEYLHWFRIFIFLIFLFSGLQAVKLSLPSPFLFFFESFQTVSVVLFNPIKFWKKKKRNEFT